MHTLKLCLCSPFPEVCDTKGLCTLGSAAEKCLPWKMLLFGRDLTTSKSLADGSLVTYSQEQGSHPGSHGEKTQKCRCTDFAAEMQVKAHILHLEQRSRSQSLIRVHWRSSHRGAQEPSAVLAGMELTSLSLHGASTETDSRHPACGGVHLVQVSAERRQSINHVCYYFPENLCLSVLIYENGKSGNLSELNVSGRHQWPLLWPVLSWPAKLFLFFSKDLNCPLWTPMVRPPVSSGTTRKEWSQSEKVQKNIHEGQG